MYVEVGWGDLVRMGTQEPSGPSKENTLHCHVDKVSASLTLSAQLFSCGVLHPPHCGGFFEQTILLTFSLAKNFGFVNK